MAVKTTTATRGSGATRRHGHDAEAAAFFPTGWLLGSYLALAVLFFLPAMMPGMMIYGSDHMGEAYYSELFASQRLAAGALPKWNPYLYGGVPFFANAMDTYYPVTVLARLVGVPTHHLPLANFVVQLFLAGLGMFLLVRELGGRRVAAYLAGLVYMFSGYTVSFILGGHDGRMIVATLAPLFFFAVHRSVRTGALRWYVLSGIVLGGAHLSNQIQSTYYLMLAGLFWFVFLLWHLQVARPASALANRLGGAALAIVIGFALVAINYVPFLSYVAESPRGGAGGRGYDYATSWSMPPEEIAGLAVPERIGILEAYWGANPFKLHTEYVGGLALIALVVGIYLLRRSRYLWFFAGLGAFALSMSFGGHTPVYRLYYALLPGVDKFRAPSISFYLVVLAIVAVAGLALDRIGALRDERRAATGRRAAAGPEPDALRTATRIGLGALVAVVLWGLVVALFRPAMPVTQPTTPEALAAAKAALNHPAYVTGVWRFALFSALGGAGLWLWVRGMLPTRALAVLLAIVSVADLWIIDKKFFRTVPAPDVSVAADDVATFLRAQPGPFRVFDLYQPQDNYLNRFGVELVAGHHPNMLRRYAEFLGAGESSYTDYHNVLGDPRFLALSNARYLVLGQPIDAPFLTPVHEGRTRSGATAYVYENSGVLPRAFLVPTATRATEGAALDRMLERDFDPSREVVLEVEPPIANADTATFDGDARVLRHEPDAVEVAVQANDSAYLVLTDNYYEGWTASVDGAPAPVLRANHTFRAVVVPPGEHSVVFRFEPRPLRAGFLITMGTWLLLAAYGVGLAVVELRRRTAAPPA
ncbi:MAG TPA: YfhO family protein [Longimicrobiales bacterium]